MPLRSALVLLLIAACALGARTARAQQAVEGTVTDAATGETLVGASVAVLGAGGAVVGGTVTNDDGRFSLRLVAFPTDLAVRYIGYTTARVRVEAGAVGPLAVALRPDETALAEAVVTPGENPAEALLRRVIARTRTQRGALGPYAVTAYSRTTILTPAGDIRGVLEAASDAYWSPANGWREVVVAARRTDNLGPAGGVPAVADDLVDLLAADVPLAGHRLMGPTHPDALGTYTAEIVSNAALDGKLVVRLAVRPRRATASAFVGTLDVLFDSADVVAADLRPGAAFLFPPPVRIVGARYRQQYVPVRADSSLWLPADLRTEFGFAFALDGLLASDPFRVERASAFSGYRLGAVAPDSLLVGAASRRAARPDSARLDAPGVAPPMTAPETAAYAAGDSLGALSDVLVFRGPLAGLARRSININAGSDPDSTAAPARFGLAFAPAIAVNPAETVRVGAALELRAGPLRAQPRAAFRLSDRGVSLGADGALALVRFRGEGRTLAAVASASDGVARRVVSTAPALGLGLLGGRGGYYDSRTASVGFRLDVGGLGRPAGGSAFSFASASRSAVVDVRLVTETARTFRPGTADSDLLDLGPTHESGTVQTVQTIRLDAEVGALGVPAEIAPRQAVRLVAEASPSGLDTQREGRAPFWRVEGVAERRFATFARRRALPPALDVRVSAGVAGGDVPAFRRFALEHALGDGALAATTFGALRSRTDTPDTGTRYVMLAYEHSFRTLPFEALGLAALARRPYNVILHGANAWTWGGTAFLNVPVGGSTHEVGLSLSGLLTGFRLDVTKRLDAPGAVVGFSLARLL